jgi:hypothetical protein
MTIALAYVDRSMASAALQSGDSIPINWRLLA